VSLAPLVPLPVPVAAAVPLVPSVSGGALVAVVVAPADVEAALSPSVSSRPDVTAVAEAALPPVLSAGRPSSLQPPTASQLIATPNQSAFDSLMVNPYSRSIPSAKRGLNRLRG
jgi:hypothetical protein